MLMGSQLPGSTSRSASRFSRWVFLASGIYGLLVLLPQYFLEDLLGRDYPPPITHPEHFYGFVGVAVSWQVAFLLIARDPVRYRLFMLPAALEKFTFGLAAVALFLGGRVSGMILGFGAVDLLLGCLFLVSFWRTAAEPPAQA
jgi:hypothetical protein